MNFYRFALVFGCCFHLHIAAAEPTAQQTEFFEKKIRPVLIEHCWNCHSAEATKLKGDLRLDSREALLAGGERGPAIVPGQPEKSRLIEAISYKDVDLQMPQKAKLPDAVIADLTMWVKMGAPWPGKTESKVTAKTAFDLAKRKAEHWAWKPLESHQPPITKDSNWPIAASDRFLLAKLEEKGIAPAKVAEANVLLRRLYFDLIGLPPSPEDLESFLRDYANGSQAALTRVVDKLLASPQFGERWARHWLDLVRYAESRGHEFEPDIPNAWQYRDYVIRAFNADVPYNQFVTEHVAGDLMPKPRLHPKDGFNESILGTGFWFLGEEVHSPVDIRADEADRFDNRIDVLTKTFLGLTVSCARCHDHKFDAISTKDYYALYGFLRSSAYRQVRFDTLEHNKQVMKQIVALREQYESAILRAFAETFRNGAERVPELLKQARAAMLSGKASDDKLVRLWTACLEKAAKDPDDPLHAWATLPANATTADVAKHFEKLIRGNSKDSKPITFMDVVHPRHFSMWTTDDASYDLEPIMPGRPKIGTDRNRPIIGFQEFRAFEIDPAFHGLRAAAGAQNDHGALGSNFRPGRTLYSPSFVIGPGKIYYYVKGNGRAYAAVDGHTVIAGPLHGGLVLNFNTKGNYQWVAQDLTAYRGHRMHLEFSPNDDGDFGVAIIAQAEKPPVLKPLPLRLGFLNNLSDKHMTPERAADRIGDEIAANTFALGKEDFFAGHFKLHGDSICLANWMLEHPDLFGVTNWNMLAKACKPFLDEQARLAALIRRESRLAPAMIDISPVNENVFIRGSHKDLGEQVPRRFIEALAGTKGIESSGSGRLELAHQMTDPKINPFVTRVIVNRVWHHLFGRGIVASTDNFGVMGERPTHPELLDHLAVQFASEGWSIKKLIRQLVLSRAYQMSSHPDEKADAADPVNLLLHRARLRRLQGEAIRDALLLDSGRLNDIMFGQSVPIHLTPFLDGRGRPASGPLDGDGRRSIYLAVRRNFLSPMMMAFDTPSPFSTVGRRTVSNVPAQALILMNDPFVHQMADLWGKKAAVSPGSVTERIARMYQQAFTRSPTATELADCHAYLEAAGKPLTDPKPWSELAHILINVKEFIYVE